MVLLLAACHGDDPPEGTRRCTAISDQQHATLIGIKTEQPGCGVLELGDYRVLGEGSFAIELFTDGQRVLPKIDATSDGSVFRGLVMVGDAALDGREPLRVWRQGYGSRSASGVAEAGPIELDAEDVPVLGGDVDPLDEVPGTSWWAGLLGRPDGGAVLVGAHSGRQSKVAVAFDDTGRTWVVWGHRGEGLPLDDGGYVWLDALYTAIGPDPNELWRRWADLAARSSSVGLGQGVPPVGVAATGSEDDVRAALAAAVDANAEVGRAPIEVLRVGEGWEVARGDWTANAAFPSGTAALAAEIGAAGLTPGLWSAPFQVDRSTVTYTTHPDWWVRGPDGTELDHDGYAVLDVTRPDAAAWLADQVAARVGEGWRHLELDGLAAAAREGTRAAPVTGTQAYALALGIVRDAAGPGVFLVGADAPMLPSAGLVDAWRSGPDDAADRDALRERALATAARGFANGRLWWADAGDLRVGEPLTATEAHGAVVTTAISGGSWRLADDLGDLPADRLDLALSADAAAAIGADVRPEDPLGIEADAVPVRWTFDLGWTALLSLGDTPVEVAGPGGTELLDGEAAGAGPRTLAPGDGEIWR